MRIDQRNHGEQVSQELAAVQPTVPCFIHFISFLALQQPLQQISYSPAAELSYLNKEIHGKEEIQASDC